MQQNSQRELFEPPQSPDTSIQLLNLDDWCAAANDASMQCFVKNTLQSMISGNAHELHIEQEAELCRIRVRINGRLTEQKVYNPALATEFLHTIAQEDHGAGTGSSANDDFGNLNLTVQIDGERVDLNIWHYIATGGKCLTLSLSAASAIPEVLEQTRLDANAKRAIREHYSCSGRSGITLICSQTDELLRSLLHALLGEVNSVERKIVSLQHSLDKSVPRVSQILANPTTTHQPVTGSKLQTLISATTHRSDHVFIDWVNSRNQDVIRALQPGTPTTLFWQGDVATGLLEVLSTNNLCSNLHTIIELRDTGIICPHCAEGYQLNKFDFKRLSGSNETSDSYFFANGCNRCNDTGIASLATVTSICDGTDAIREALSTNSLQAIQQAIASAQGTASIAAQLETLARTGKISFEDWIRQQ